MLDCSICSKTPPLKHLNRCPDHMLPLYGSESKCACQTNNFQKLERHVLNYTKTTVHCVKYSADYLKSHSETHLRIQTQNKTEHTITVFTNISNTQNKQASVSNREIYK